MHLDERCPVTQMFEYMSGCDIGTPRGGDGGGLAGDPTEALHWQADNPRRFEAPVGRFGLVADEGVV